MYYAHESYSSHTLKRTAHLSGPVGRFRDMLSTHLSGPHTLADQLGEKGAAGAKKLRKTLIMSEKIIDFS